MENYRNKVVIITGACGGIGEAIAEKFADAGAALALCDIRQNELSQTAEKCRQAGATVHSNAIDVADETPVRGFCETVAQTFGTIDCLINTVGIVDCPGDVEELSLSMWDQDNRRQSYLRFSDGKVFGTIYQTTGRHHPQHRFGVGLGKSRGCDDLFSDQSRTAIAHSERSYRFGKIRHLRQRYLARIGGDATIGGSG